MALRGGMRGTRDARGNREVGLNTHRAEALRIPIAWEGADECDTRDSFCIRVLR